MEHIQEKQSKRIFHRAIYALIGFALIMMGFVAYWQFYPYKPITAQTQPFMILDEDKVLKAGDILAYRADFCKDFSGEIRMDRMLVNDILIQFTPHFITASNNECQLHEDQMVKLPDNTPNGVYHMEITTTVQVNPIRSISLKFITEDFSVENPILELEPDQVEELEEIIE